jgi:UDP-N-acetylglucosamine enolpyruvyl transferase
VNNARCRSAVRLLTGLVTGDETVVDPIAHADCGHQNIEDEFARLGAQICRVPG